VQSRNNTVFPKVEYGIFLHKFNGNMADDVMQIGAINSSGEYVYNFIDVTLDITTKG